MYWFTSDEHYGHKNIIKYCNRPFVDIDENDETIIANLNEVVKDNDTVIHGGDTTLANKMTAQKYIERLKGKHIFIIGSHDYWLGKKKPPTIWEKKIEGQYVVVCHYAMMTWPRAHYGSWMLFGHSHGSLDLPGKMWDIGVDNNGFYPVSFEQIYEIMKERNYENADTRKRFYTH